MKSEGMDHGVCQDVRVLVGEDDWLKYRKQSAAATWAVGGVDPEIGGEDVRVRVQAPPKPKK